MKIDKELDQILIKTLAELGGGRSAKKVKQNYRKDILSLISNICKDLIKEKPRTYTIEGKKYNHSLGGIMALDQYEEEMKLKKIKDTFVISLERGEKIIETLKQFCTKQKIKCGYFFGIGSLDEAEWAHYIVDNKKYTSKKYKRPLEITNMSGNITTMKEEIYLHCHITLSDEKMKVIAGHLKEGTIGATCEIVLVKLDSDVSRKYDNDIGLNLLDL
jgi:predicted DNA-binding protein with PD1-like motif